MSVVTASLLTEWRHRRTAHVRARRYRSGCANRSEIRARLTVLSITANKMLLLILTYERRQRLSQVSTLVNHTYTTTIFCVFYIHKIYECYVPFIKQINKLLIIDRIQISIEDSVVISIFDIIPMFVTIDIGLNSIQYTSRAGVSWA